MSIFAPIGHLGGLASTAYCTHGLNIDYTHYGLAVMALAAPSTRAAPGPQWRQDQDTQYLNEVWAPGPHKQFSFKTLIKALVRFNGGDKSQLEFTETTIAPDIQELSDPSASPGELSDGATLDVSEDLLGVPTPGPLEDDALNIKPIVKPDKSYRFTHNFRFGYGALPGLP